MHTTGAAAFVTAAAKQLPSTDVWCILYPSLRHFIKADIHLIDEPTLLMCLKPPVRLEAGRDHVETDTLQLSRPVFDAAVQWAMKTENSPFWTGQRRSAKTETTKESMMASRKTTAPSSRPAKSEEWVNPTLSLSRHSRNFSLRDEANLAKLRQLGMAAGDEAKLTALRDYIAKLSKAIARSALLRSCS
jgi:phosphoinositide-3-kinase regulatory subunit 4